jgi:hypothetical protein
MQTLHSVFQDITNVQVASVPAIELLPLKCRKFGKQSKLFEGGLVQFLAKVIQEIAIVREALGKIDEDLGWQSIILQVIYEVIQSDET